MAVTKAAARRARLKLLGSILTTHGYAILALAWIQPLLSGQFVLTSVRIGGLVAGLAIQALAIYIAPLGEPS